MPQSAFAIAEIWLVWENVVAMLPRPCMPLFIAPPESPAAFPFALGSVSRRTIIFSLHRGRQKHSIKLYFLGEADRTLGALLEANRVISLPWSPNSMFPLPLPIACACPARLAT